MGAGSWKESLFFDRLKHDTRAEHEAIERVVASLAPFASVDAYRAYLKRTLGFYAPVERALSRILAPERNKVPALEQDLRFLGLDGAALSQVPRIDWSPPPGARLWGCAYVLEGSTLGGRVLLRLATQKLGVTPDAGAAFLAGYAQRTAAMWSLFRQSLTEALREDQLEELVAGAAATFDTFTAWLCGALQD